MPEPDYFDRLLARQGGGDVRPRLPGPFERAEPSWTETVADPQVAPVLRVVREPAAAPAPPPIRVERHTEVRVEPLTPVVHQQLVTHTVVSPPARPDQAVPVQQTTSPAAADVRLPSPRAAPTVVDGADATNLISTPSRPVSVARPRPRREQRVTTQRGSPNLPATRRRPQPPAEPAVSIRIGRLEVRTAGDGKPAPRSPRPGRPAPAVSLIDYLSAGRSS